MSSGVSKEAQTPFASPGRARNSVFQGLKTSWHSLKDRYRKSQKPASVHASRRPATRKYTPRHAERDAVRSFFPPPPVLSQAERCTYGIISAEEYRSRTWSWNNRVDLTAQETNASSVAGTSAARSSPEEESTSEKARGKRPVSSRPVDSPMTNEQFLSLGTPRHQLRELHCRTMPTYSHRYAPNAESDGTHYEPLEYVRLADGLDYRPPTPGLWSRNEQRPKLGPSSYSYPSPIEGLGTHQSQEELVRAQSSLSSSSVPSQQGIDTTAKHHFGHRRNPSISKSGPSGSIIDASNSSSSGPSMRRSQQTGHRVAALSLMQQGTVGTVDRDTLYYRKGQVPEHLKRTSHATRRLSSSGKPSPLINCESSSDSSPTSILQSSPPSTASHNESDRQSRTSTTGTSIPPDIIVVEDIPLAQQKISIEARQHHVSESKTADLDSEKRARPTVDEASEPAVITTNERKQTEEPEVEKAGSVSEAGEELENRESIRVGEGAVQLRQSATKADVASSMVATTLPEIDTDAISLAAAMGLDEVDS